MEELSSLRIGQLLCRHGVGGAFDELAVDERIRGVPAYLHVHMLNYSQVTGPGISSPRTCPEQGADSVCMWRATTNKSVRVKFVVVLVGGLEHDDMAAKPDRPSPADRSVPPVL